MAKKDLLKKAEVLANAGEVEEAEKICRKILKKKPSQMEATFLLSGIMMVNKKFEESEPLLRKVLAENPNHVSAMNNLGIIYREYYHDLEKARELFEKVVKANPGHFRALMNLGNIYGDYGQDERSEEYYQKALEVNPGSFENAVFLTHIGNVAFRKKEYEEAINYLERALKLSPNNTDILRNYLLVLYGKGDKAGLMAKIEDILKLPQPGRAYFPCFSFAKRNCFWEISEKLENKVVELILGGTSDYSALEMSNLDLLAASGISYEDLLAIHRITGQTLEGKRMAPVYTFHEKAFKDISKIRIGYISGDFKQHVINTFIRGLFNFHDRARFEIYCYSNTAEEDETTEQYKQSADFFVNITGMMDVSVAERIHDDGIHLLVNISGYTLGSRMAVMAYQAAPVQLMYLGYPYTSGLDAVDYFVSDPYTDGPENAEYFVEKQLHLPECFATFDRLHDREIVPEPPFKKNGFVTFGSLVNTYKLTPGVVEVWSQMMREVPDSRIILNNPNYDFDQMCRKILDVFNRHGIEDTRVDIVFEKHESGFHLRYYNEIDIALDTFPMTGGTTTHEALWMGVPVVTLVGDIYPHRLSYSILSNAGLDLSEVIAFSKEEYIEKAVTLAKNPKRIKALHTLIPESLDQSIQCDPIRHTKQMEELYIEAWERKFPNDPIQFKPNECTGSGGLRDLLTEVIDAVNAGKLTHAEVLCRKIFKIDPENMEALNLFGSIQLMQKNYDVAEQCLELVISVSPNNTQALNNMGLICLQDKRDFEAAERYFNKVLEFDPNHINGLMNLGNVYRASRQLQKAEIYYKKALELAPENGELFNNLGSLKAIARDYEKARVFYRKALNYMPEKSEIFSNLMAMNRKLGDHEAALALIPQVMSMSHPGVALFSIFNYAKMNCFWEETKTLLPKVQKLVNEGKAILDSFGELNLSLLAIPDLEAAMVFDIHQKTGTMIDQLRETSPYDEYPQKMALSERLKIAYVSPDFYRHVSNVCFRGLMNFHDKSRFEIYCYSSSHVEDEVSAQYRATSDHFVNVAEMSDRQLAERIYRDGIHFLIDLAGYTTNGRMGVLSYRPAPVQMMYLGYPYTSGQTSVDYFISDPYLNGSENEAFFTEKQLCLPESFMSFSSLSEQPIDPVMPNETKGYVTFGSMNNLYKLNPELIETWSHILKRVSDSRMIINHPNLNQAETRVRIKAEFEKNDIDVSRIRMIWDQHPKGSHFHYYNEMDVILDAFPLTGGTNTIDAVWMGVPVVTLVGKIYPHRLSYSILKNIGIDVDDLIAFNTEEYVEKAVALASHPDRINTLHQDIPVALKQSILCDPFRLTRQMEAAYIEGWNRKFPDEQIEIKPADDAIHYVSVGSDLEIAVEGSPDDLETYVLSEQGKWFDSEYHFAHHWIQPGMRMLDIGAGVGSYTIPFSKKIGKTGKSWAVTHSAMETQYLHYSKGHNELDHLDVIMAVAGGFQLDEAMAGLTLSNIDFVRIHGAAHIEVLLSGGKQFFSQNAPLVLFSIKENNIFQSNAVPILKDLGYASYRFVPGLNLLIPFTLESNLDGFALNLFACKVDRAALLAEEGLLIPEIKPVSELPNINVKEWQPYLGGMPFASALKTQWQEDEDQDEGKVDEWENYHIALNLYSRAKNQDRTAEDRYAALHAAYGLLVMLVGVKMNLPRLLSLSRVMLDLGKREEAVNLLNRIVTLFEEGGEVALNEPFIALSDDYASVDPGERLAEWLFSSVLMVREKSRAFSTYFTGEEALPVLEAIRATGFYDPQIEKQAALIRARFPHSNGTNPQKPRLVSC